MTADVSSTRRVRSVTSRSIFCACAVASVAVFDASSAMALARAMSGRMSLWMVATMSLHLPGDARQHDDRADLHERHQRRRHGDDAEEHLAPVVHSASPGGLPGGCAPRACS